MKDNETKVVDKKDDAVAGVATDQPASDRAPETATPKTRRKKKVKRHISKGQVHVLATFNNTIVTVTDDQGNAITSASAGSTGFRGSKKGTAYGAQVATEKALEAAKATGLSKVEVLVKGVGLGRDAAVRTLAGQRIDIDNIKDVTAVPHGGSRPRKPKRN